MTKSESVWSDTDEWDDWSTLESGGKKSVTSSIAGNTKKGKKIKNGKNKKSKRSPHPTNIEMTVAKSGKN